MDLEFVADSEDEDQLRLSPSISPRLALESAFSLDIGNNPGIGPHRRPSMDELSHYSW
jgi:hypothetical protein